ncbi:hypothetical protein ABIB35_000961 [Arthrobacter sp. UYP6]|uniref:hypothetical protein n=1 Tax=Arthrobacter sp. UYP6 TaxID=1756378 RepID=UPI003394D0DD
MHRARQPAFLAPFAAAAVLFLGLVAVIAGILGMHMFSASHHEPATAVAAFAAAPGELSAELGPAVGPGISTHPAADAGTHHPADGGVQPDCSEPCSQDQGHAGSVCTLMIFVLVLLLMPKALSLRGRFSSGLRRVRPAQASVPQTPSLLQLCISRT